MEDKKLALNWVRARLDEAERGEGHGILILVNVPGENAKVVSLKTPLSLALAMTATAAELFTNMVREYQEQVPEGTVFH